MQQFTSYGNNLYINLTTCKNNLQSLLITVKLYISRFFQSIQTVNEAGFVAPKFQCQRNMLVTRAITKTKVISLRFTIT